MARLRCASSLGIGCSCRPCQTQYRMNLSVDRVPSPLGMLTIVTNDDTLVALDFDDSSHRMHRLLKRHYGGVKLCVARERIGARDALDAYFAGDLCAINALPISTGGNVFARSVWKALRAIAPGTTEGYGDLAARIGRPRAARAVGLANSANPIAIVVPCHRVIGANRTLTGYAGGLARKEWLPRHEGAAPLFDMNRTHVRSRSI